MIRTESSYGCLASGRTSTLARLTGNRKTKHAQLDKPKLPTLPLDTRTLRHQVSQVTMSKPQSSKAEAEARKSYEQADTKYKLLRDARDTWRSDVASWKADLKKVCKIHACDQAVLEERTAFFMQRIHNAKAQQADADAKLKAHELIRNAKFVELEIACGIRPPPGKP